MRSLARSNQHFRQAVQRLPLGVSSNFRYWGDEHTIYVDHGKGGKQQLRGELPHGLLVVDLDLAGVEAHEHIEQLLAGLDGLGQRLCVIGHHLAPLLGDRQKADRVGLVAAGQLAQQAIQTIFDFIWREGRNMSDAEEWNALTDAVGLTDANEKLADPTVKNALRSNTDEAIARGVFGVPTLIVDDELFWGYDAADFLLEYLNQPDAIRRDIFEPVNNLAQGAARRKRAE